MQAEIAKEKEEREEDVKDLWEELLEIRDKQYKMDKRIDDTKDDLETLKSVVGRRIKAVEQAMQEQLEREERVRITLCPTRRCMGKKWHGTGPDDGKANEINKTVEASPVGKNLAPRSRRQNSPRGSQAL